MSNFEIIGFHIDQGATPGNNTNSAVIMVIIEYMNLTKPDTRMALTGSIKKVIMIGYFQVPPVLIGISVTMAAKASLFTIIKMIP